MMVEPAERNRVLRPRGGQGERSESLYLCVVLCVCVWMCEHEGTRNVVVFNAYKLLNKFENSPNFSNTENYLPRVFFFVFNFFYSALFHSVCFLFFRALFGSFSADVVFTFNSLFRASTGFSTRIYFIILSANIFRAGRSQFVSLTFFFSFSQF